MPMPEPATAPVPKPRERLSFRPEDERQLTGIALEQIRRGLLGLPLVKELAVAPHLLEPGASFVTIERDERLLGCIGTIEPHRPLAVDVAQNALAAAFADYRTRGVNHDDFAVMSLKISVLSNSEVIPATCYSELEDMIRPGVDGLIVDAGRNRSTLLPSVWSKVDGTAEFLEILWAKAGLSPEQWPAGIRVSRYMTHEFGDPGPREPI